MRWFGAMVLSVALLMGARTGAQTTPPTDAPTTSTTLPAAVDEGPPPGPADPFLRGVPRTAARNYLLACRDGDYEKAANYLDLRHVPREDRDERGPILARQFKAVLDRTIWVDLDSLSNEPEGDRDDGLAVRRDVLASIRTKEGPTDLLLERVPREDGVLIWKVAAATVDRIPDLYAEFGYGPLIERLPETFFRVSFLEVQLWQWVGLLALVLIAAVGAWIGGALAIALVKPIARRTSGPLDDRVLAAVRGPVRFGVALLLFTFGHAYLKLAVPVERLVGGVLQAAMIVLWTWLFLRGAEVAVNTMADRLRVRGQYGALAILPLARRSANFFIVAMGVVAAMQHIGFNVTGVIAGLGVGGLAVALAAQKTVENLIGGIMLVADQPVRVGDLCRFGTQVGTVEDIGLRSTRIRTAERSVVSIPNAVFSSTEIENYSRRDRIRIGSSFFLRPDTSSEQVRAVLDAAGQGLRELDKIESGSVQVRLIRLGPTGPEIEVTAYVRTTDADEFGAVRERAFLGVLDAIAAAGASLASGRVPPA